MLSRRTWCTRAPLVPLAGLPLVIPMVPIAGPPLGTLRSRGPLLRACVATANKYG